MVNARLARRIGLVPTLVTALAANALVYIGAGLAPDPIALAALLALCGFVVTLWNVATVSLRQQIVPRQLFGRVNSVYRMLAWGLTPFGALAGGFTASAFGLRAPFVIAGALRALVLLAALPVLLSADRTPRPAH